MFTRLLAAFILVPLLELVLLVQVAQYTSLWTTIMLVIVTGVIGSWLARREGVMAWFRFQSALAEGRAPSQEIQDGLMIVFAAALLLTPGLLTDALGFTLLLPQGREFIRRTLVKRYMQRFKVHFHAPDDFAQEPLNRTPRESSCTIDADSFQRKAE
ncbi:FxsA family protein [Rhodopirellula sp.]|nr:FxsA family protein [Rhodopirellula sp.]